VLSRGNVEEGREVARQAEREFARSARNVQP